VAGFSGFTRNEDYFEAVQAAREAPQVEFPGPNR